MTKPTTDAIDILVASCPQPDQLFPLSEAPTVVVELTGGRKPHLSAIQRWVRVGLAGGAVKLRAARAGRTTLTCRRWLLQLWSDAAEVARQRDITHPHPKPSRPGPAPLTDAESEVLERHGVGGA